MHSFDLHRSVHGDSSLADFRSGSAQYDGLFLQLHDTGFILSLNVVSESEFLCCLFCSIPTDVLCIENCHLFVVGKLSQDTTEQSQ